MDDQSLRSLLFFLVLYLLVGLLLVWLMRRRIVVKHDEDMQEPDDVFMEPGTIGKQTNYYSVHFLDQIDALIASWKTQAQVDAGIEALVVSRTTEAQLEADIEEMQRRAW